jgi:hypothetical protein
MAYLNRLRFILIIVLATLGLVACSGPQPAQNTTTDTDGGHAVRQEVTWVNIKGFELPTADAGPKNPKDTPPSGYTHDAFGSMLAATHLSIALDLADQKTFGMVVNKATINDDGRKQWVAARVGIEIGPVQKDRIPTLKAWTATVSSDHNTSEVLLYWQQYDGSITEQRRDMVWQADDWKIKLPHNPQQPVLRAVTEIPPEATQFNH